MGTRGAYEIIVITALAAVSCADNTLGTDRTDAAFDARSDSATPDVGGDTTRPDTDTADAPEPDAAPDTTVPDAGMDMAVDTTPPPPPARDCVYASADGEQELDVGPSSSERLRFLIEDLPDPSLVESATLTFTSYDSDHPGEEGTIRVNGMGMLDLPAMVAWDNMDGPGSVDVSGMTVAGDNRIVFGPGPLSRSFFRIRDVSLQVRARVAECTEGPTPPPPTAVTRSMQFTEASYSNRRTWVIPCAPGTPRHNPLRNYAFTASGDEHDETDCDGDYMPGGNRRGTATFRFNDVVPARYRITIRSRHTENRNPMRALFIVDGVERRIDQTTSSDYENDVWGERRLGGNVDVVLDSTREGESDCVTSVTLEPIGG